ARWVGSPNVPSVNTEIADLWSLGVTIYQCITGRLPFFHSNVSTLLGILEKRPNKEAIAFHNGKYVHELDSMIHPRWLLELLQFLIQMLFGQSDYKVIVTLMSSLSKVHSRLVYNAGDNLFHVAAPQDSPRYENKWKIDLAKFVKTTGKNIFVASERGRVLFLKTLRDENNCQMTWRKQKDGYLRLSEDTPISTYTNIDGRCLIVSETDVRRIEQITTDNQEEVMSQINSNLRSESVEHASAIAFHDLMNLQQCLVCLRELSSAMAHLRKRALVSIKEAV
ncbi:hypothetical protein PFISCL1PPCAC_3679, partial [Pristionchus fissidentatus]